MTGSLQIKNNKYYLVINLVDLNGKRKPKWISTGLNAKGNKKRAESMLREKLREYEKLHGNAKSQMRFSDWVREWLKSVEKRVDIVTFEGYTSCAQRHILPYFDAKNTVLCEITRSMLQTFIDEKSLNGRLDGTGGLAPASIRHIRNILNQSLKAAQQSGWIVTNPCDGLRLPRQQKPEFSFYNAEQLNTLFAAIQGEQLWPLVRITAVYGLRKSELLGLQWSSIDFKANTLTIKHTVVKQKSLVTKDKTKNAASRRTFPLTPEMRSLFEQIKAEEAVNRRLFGKEYNENSYIFKWPDGRPFSPNYVSHKFSALLKQHGLPHIRFHDLRHSCASMLIAQGFGLKDVQEWLGHADITLTANTYAHLDMKRKQSIAESIAGCF